MNSQVQKEVDLDTDGPARGSRTEGLGKTEGEASGTRGSEAQGRAWGPAGEVFQIPYPISQLERKALSKPCVIFRKRPTKSAAEINRESVGRPSGPSLRMTPGGECWEAAIPRLTSASARSQLRFFTVRG